MQMHGSTWATRNVVCAVLTQPPRGGLCQGFEVGPGQPAAALNQALLMKEMEQLEKALALFDELVVRHPDHAEDHNGRVACVTSLDWVGGGEDHSRAVELSPENKNTELTCAMA